VWQLGPLEIFAMCGSAAPFFFASIAGMVVVRPPLVMTVVAASYFAVEVWLLAAAPLLAVDVAVWYGPLSTIG